MKLNLGSKTHMQLQIITAKDNKMKIFEIIALSKNLNAGLSLCLYQYFYIVVLLQF